MRKSTIKDVAKLANVAVSTVSLVVNGKGYVAKETEIKVIKAIEELNYHPQRSARGLVTQKSGNFGFILSHDHFSQAEPFYTKIFLGTEFEARALDYYILLTTIDKESASNEVPRFLLEKNVDGVILAGTVPVKIVNYIRKNNFPFVLVDYSLSDIHHSSVLIDNAMGIQLVFNHLYDLGHRDIAFIGGDMTHPGMRVRCETYKSCLLEKGLQFNPDLIECEQASSRNEDGYIATNRLIHKNLKMTAIIAANDAMAIGALRASRENKLRIPKDIAITGFDNVEASQTARPALTTVHVPKEEMGAAAVRYLVDIVGKRSSEGMKMVLPVKLITRESTLGVDR